MQEISDAVPRNADGRRIFSDARFDKATFQGLAGFDKVTFEGRVRFDWAEFKMPEEILEGGTALGQVTIRDYGDAASARFAGAIFKGYANFTGASFEGPADFTGASFGGRAEFGAVTFAAGVSFGFARFEDYAQFFDARFGPYIDFEGTTFKGDAKFEKAAFEADAYFQEASFEGQGDFEEASFEGRARFSRATFKGDATFTRAMFKGEHVIGASGDAYFTGATFRRRARFGGAVFKDDAQFQSAAFDDLAEFKEARFGSLAGFEEVSFRRAEFARASFGGVAKFREATFLAITGITDFSGATFKGPAEFTRARFGGAISEGSDGTRLKSINKMPTGGATFDGASFESGATFDWLSFEGNASFAGATFNGDVSVLHLTVGGSLNLDQVRFSSLIRIDTDASALTCRRGRFPGGVRFDVRRAVIRLDDTDLSVPSLLTGPPASDPAGLTAQPKLLSLQGANVAGLVLGNVDLTGCRFAGAHNLDKLRLEAQTVFGFSPAVAGWERRQVIAEESVWRAAKPRPGRWIAPEWPEWNDYPAFIDRPEPPSPGAVAGVYRALRKGREDSKDEPGATDFYYGEMEMRRHDRGATDSAGSHGRATRFVLFAYWLVSGYALRAWRSLVALAVVTALFAVAFRFIGFAQPPEPASYWTSLLYAFRSTISLTDSQVTLTAWGSFFQALLRITGPILLGLTLLALRGRVKR